MVVQAKSHDEHHTPVVTGGVLIRDFHWNVMVDGTLRLVDGGATL